MSQESQATNPPRRKRRLRWWQKAMLLFIAALTAAGGVGYWLWCSEPAYWTANQTFLATQGPVKLTAMAESLEQRVLAQLSEVDASGPLFNGAGPGAPQVTPTRTPNALAAPGQPAKPGGPRKMTITVTEANAWLRNRLPQWMAHQDVTMPSQITEPMVAIEAGRVVLAFRLNTPKVKQVVSMAFNVRMTDKGQLGLKLHSIKGGRLPIPLETITTKLRDKGAPGIAPSGAGAASGGGGGGVLSKLAAAFEGQTFDPVHKIDGKKVRLLSFTIRPDAVAMTVKVEPKKPGAKTGPAKTTAAVPTK